MGTDIIGGDRHNRWLFWSHLSHFKPDFDGVENKVGLLSK